MKRIIIIKGISSTGKTTIIKQYYNWLTSHFVCKQLHQNVRTNGDFLSCIKVSCLKVAFNSAGDTLAEVSKIDALVQEHRPDIIICASRTKGEGYHKLIDNYEGYLQTRIHPAKATGDTAIQQQINSKLEELKGWMLGVG